MVAIQRAAWLDPATSRIAGSIDGVLGNGAARRLLRGEWLGHTVHPALTDLPIGFWTAAWVLDVLPSRRTDRVATTFVALGVVAAVPTAATGVSELAEADAEGRRVALVHGAVNTLALACYLASLVARLGGRRRRGHLWAHAGATAATAGGWLGGHLIAAMGVGVGPRTAR